MEQEQWLKLKMLFLLGYNLKIVIYWEESIFGGENKDVVGDESTGGVLGGRDGQKPCWVCFILYYLKISGTNGS